MCFLVWSTYIGPGSGTSEAIRLMAACVSVMIVSRFGAVYHLEAVFGVLARAAHSAPQASWLYPMWVLIPIQE